MSKHVNFPSEGLSSPLNLKLGVSGLGELLLKVLILLVKVLFIELKLSDLFGLVLIKSLVFVAVL